MTQMVKHAPPDNIFAVICESRREVYRIFHSFMKKLPEWHTIYQLSRLARPKVYRHAGPSTNEGLSALITTDVSSRVTLTLTTLDPPRGVVISHSSSLSAAWS